MSKEKQIEEMADKLCTTSYFCSTEDWDSCDIKDSDEYCHRCRKVAERLYDADYRKIVQCKDCKYFDDEDFCSAIGCFVKDNDFCSYAEAKGGV